MAKVQPDKLFWRPLGGFFLLLKQRKLSAIDSHIPFHYFDTNKLAAPRTYKMNENNP